MMASITCGCEICSGSSTFRRLSLSGKAECMQLWLAVALLHWSGGVAEGFAANARRISIRTNTNTMAKTRISHLISPPSLSQVSSPVLNFLGMMFNILASLAAAATLVSALAIPNNSALVVHLIIASNQVNRVADFTLINQPLYSTSILVRTSSS
ncbi:hypothetical protein FIBSPDRAFT_358878 [Athelia psychrophila]|uniref:Uncharacterized protein n=1 Tax=Athelia psychrophila TaxID=1759441 RepID=A0A166PL65_9AGAM|nr:hypothetical protein FIBSPDRAFT_358878 [Fibularhizoctonia sp. CBS 109695]